MTKKDSDTETSLIISEVSSNYDSTINNDVVESNIHLSTSTTKLLKSNSYGIILLCLFTNVFLSSLDSTMLATLLGAIASDTESLNNISWVATSYLLSCAAFQPLFGKISNVFGRKPIIILCGSLFGLGCLICGLTKSFWLLVIGRFVTGIGGGGFNSMATITLSDIVPIRQRGLYQGYVNIFFHFGAASGGVIAGVFQDYFGWRMAFLVQVPVCIICGILTYVYFELPEGSPGLGLQSSNTWKKLKSLDYFGSLILVLSLFLLMIASSLAGNEIDFSSLTFQALILFSVIGLAAFYYYELKVAEQPIIPVALLHNRTVLFSSLSCWFISMNMFSSIYYVPFYWSSVKNLTPLDSGLRLIPSSVSSAISSFTAGYTIKRSNKYRKLHLFTGFLVVLGSLFVYMSSKTDSLLHDSIVTVPLRYGTSSVITILLVAMVATVNSSEQALVTSIQYGFRSTGSTLGVSIASAILQVSLRDTLNENFARLTNVPEKFLDKIELIKNNALQDPSYAFNEAPEFFKSSIINAYDSSTHTVFLFVIVTAVLSFLSIGFIEEHDLEKHR